MGIMCGQQRASRTWMAFGFITIGLLLLIGIDKLWPLFIMLPGLGFMSAYWSGHKATAPMAIPGMLIAGTGGILLFQSITGYWESWIYAWMLYGVFLGIGLVMMGERLEEKDLANVGRVMAWISFAATVVIGGFVILITTPAFQFLLMIALFIAGGYLLLNRSGSTETVVITSGKAKRSDPVVEENVRRVKVQLEQEEVA